MTVASVTGSPWAQNATTSTPSAGSTFNVTPAAPAAPVQTSQGFFTPSTHVDPSTGIAVLVVLDDQGKILEQFPSQQVVDEYRRHQGTGQAPTPSPQPSPASTGQSQPIGSASGSGDTSQGHTDSTA